MLESKNANKKRSQIMSNINIFSKNILKKLYLNPVYENVTMNQVKKILRDSFITNESVTASNSLVLKNFKTLNWGVAVEVDNEETDTDTNTNTHKSLM